MATNQGLKIRELLRINGLTQTDLADFMDKNQGWISTVLRRKTIDSKFIKKCAKFFKMPIDEFIKAINEEPEKDDYVAKLEAERDLLKKQVEKNDYIIQMQKEKIEEEPEKDELLLSKLETERDALKREVDKNNYIIQIQKEKIEDLNKELYKFKKDK